MNSIEIFNGVLYLIQIPGNFGGKVKIEFPDTLRILLPCPRFLHVR